MMTVGITGRSGCGESTVTACFAAHGVPVASGVSWRAAPCDVRRQVDEADRLMYLDKERYYGRPGYYRKGGE